MNVSVIIVTFNRVRSLERTLETLLEQISRSIEIIIVDDGVESPKMNDLICRMRERFYEKWVTLKHILNERENSLTICRNIGFDHSSGDIILYLDDDVILDKYYIREILKVYEKNPEAKGVQGYITNSLPKKSRRRLQKLLFQIKENSCQILPSWEGTYPCQLNDIAQCEWLSGCCQSYRREVLEEFRFDENLKRYSLGEDQDFSYRVFKKYPGSLYITPYARLFHNMSFGGLADEIVVYMSQVYSFYLFYKNINQNLMNKLFFLRGIIINLAMHVAGFVAKPTINTLLQIKFLLNAYMLCLRNIDQIKNGELDFFNKKYLNLK